MVCHRDHVQILVVLVNHVHKIFHIHDMGILVVARVHVVEVDQGLPGGGGIKLQRIIGGQGIHENPTVQVGQCDDVWRGK